MSRSLRPILLTALLALAAWILARSPLPIVLAQSQVVGSGPNRAGLVIRFDDGHVEKRCVAFQEQDISGLELLQRSGLSDVITDPAGAVCSIGGQGCPSDDCFCQCPFPNCQYWAYYHRQNGAWVYAQDGQVYAQIVDGSLDGWSWGQGDFQQGVEPPQMNFDQVCPATSTDATATPTATETQSAGSGNRPLVTFAAAAYTITAGQCTTLSWQTTDATSVTLENTSVPFQGAQQVCPNATQSWTLVATNSTGQTSRQVTVAVQSANPGDAQPTALPTATPRPSVAGTTTARPTAGAPRLGTPTVSFRTPRPVITEAPQPLPNATVATVLPQPTLDLQGGGVPFAPTSALLPVMTPTPELTLTRFEFSPPPTETPRPRRVLNPDDPTPTPLLVARAEVNPSGGSAASSAARPASQSVAGSTQSVQSRSFTPGLLPGYAAYVASLAVLLIMGWYVLRRRHGQVSVRTDE